MIHKSKEFLEKTEQCEILCKRCIEICQNLTRVFEKKNELECSDQIDKCFSICGETIEGCKRFADHCKKHLQECKKPDCIELCQQSIEACEKTQDACTNCLIQLEQDQTLPPYTYGEDFMEWMTEVVDACKTCVFRCGECIKYCQESKKDL